MNGPAAVTEGVTKDVSQTHKQILCRFLSSVRLHLYEDVRGQESVRGQFLGSRSRLMLCGLGTNQVQCREKTVLTKVSLETHKLKTHLLQTQLNSTMISAQQSVLGMNTTGICYQIFTPDYV